MKKENWQKIQIETNEKLNIRTESAKVIEEVLFSKRKLKDLVDKRFEKIKIERDRSLLKEITYGVMRRLKIIDYAIERFLEKDIKSLNSLALSILRVGAYQILFLDKIPHYACVNESVKSAKELKIEQFKGLINTILRQICKEKEEILEFPYKKPFLESLSYKYGMPIFIIKRYLKRFKDEEVEEILDSLNKESLTSILFFSYEDYLTAREILLKEGFKIEENRSLKLQFYIKGGDVSKSESFKKGLFYICDASSSLPALLLPTKSGTFSLDACSAPGTKTVIISKRLEENSFLLSSDSSRWRIKRLIENKEKYGLKNVFIVAQDLLKGPSFKDKFYSVIVDAPCSSLGTLKKNPEIRWQIDEERIKKEGERQIKIMLNACDAVCKGGYLLYSVCSIEKEETSDVIETFLKERKDFVKAKLPIDEKIKSISNVVENSSIFVMPNNHKGDAFFISLLRRKVND